jgi:hypothetical protein
MSTGSDMYRGLDLAKRYAEFSCNDLNPPDDSAAPPEWVSDTQTVDYQMGIVLARIIENFSRAFMVPDADSLLPSVLSIYETSVLVSEVDQYLDPGKPPSLNIDTEKRFTHEIWDLRSELVMIGDVLGQQETVLEDIPSANKGFDPVTLLTLPDKLLHPSYKRAYTAHWPRIFGARKLLEKYRQRIRKIEADAERIDKAIQDMLNLKRTFASIKEAQNSSEAAQNSLRLARSSVVLNAAVVGFTVGTVIFTPLSFLTGLFALATDELRKLLSSTNETKDVYVSSYVGGIFGKSTDMLSSPVLPPLTISSGN